MGSERSRFAEGSHGVPLECATYNPEPPSRTASRVGGVDVRTGPRNDLRPSG